MSRRLRGVALLLVMLLAAPAAAVFGLAQPAAAGAYGEHTYPSNPFLDPNRTFQPVFQGQQVAQSFRATETFVLLNVSLYLENAGGSTNTINITIRPDDPSTHTPMATVLGTSRLVTPAGQPGNYTLSFNPGPVLKGGGQYWILASNPAPQASQGYNWYASGGNTYAAGWAAIYNTTNPPWATLVTDLFFVISGRTFDATLGLSVLASSAQAMPGDVVTFSIFMNNTGNQSAKTGWINDSLPAGFTYLSDSAGAMSPPSTTPFPNFTFQSVANGPHSFAIRARVNIGIPPGAILTNTVTLRFANATGILEPVLTVQVSVTVGVVMKQLYLAPSGSPPRLLRTLAPNTTAASFVNITRGNFADFVLAQGLTRPFRAMNLTLFLFVDSQTGKTQTLVLDLTLIDKNGTLTSTVAARQWTFQTDATRGFQAVSVNFGVVNYTFAVAHQIQFRIAANNAGTDGLFTAFNSTIYPARLVLATTTYVDARLTLQDGRGPASVWSPYDSLGVSANLTDPFGANAILGARVNVTAPNGTAVVNWTSMTRTSTDPGNPPAWSLFRLVLSPPLVNGSYRVDVTAIEDNGAKRINEATAVVRSPSFSLADVASVARAKAGDAYTYELWYNNSGSGIASKAWLNDTIPSQLSYMGASLPPTSVTGNVYSWTLANVTPGNHTLVIDVRVGGSVTQVAWIRNSATLVYVDEKGYSWPSLSAHADVVLNGPVLTVRLSSVPLAYVHANETVTYVVNLTNSGDPAPEIWFNDTLAPGFVFVSDTAASLGGTTTLIGNNVNIVLAGMPSGAVAPITWSFNVVARAPATLPRNGTLLDSTRLEYSGVGGVLMPPVTSGRSLAAAAPLLTNVTIAFPQSFASIGESVAGILSFANVGNEAASVVDIVLTTPAGLTFLNSSATVLSTGSPLQLELRSVGVGRWTVYANFSIDSTAVDRQALIVNGSISCFDGIGNPEPTVLIPGGAVRVALPAVRLVVSYASGFIEAGTNFTYRIDLANAGSGVADDVWLNLTLPAPFALRSSTLAVSPTISGNLFTWHWQSQAPGPRSGNLTFQVRSSAPNGTKSSLNFSLDYSDLGGVVFAAPPITANVTIVSPVLLVTLTADRNQVVAGNPYTYSVILRNIGGSAAGVVTVTDSLDPQLDVVSIDATSKATGNGTLTWTFTDLAPNQSTFINLTVRLRPGLPPNTIVANVIDVAYTNSAGTVVGYAHAPLTVTVAADLLPLLWIFLGGLLAGGVALTIVYRRRGMQIEDAFLVYQDGVLIAHLSRTIMKEKDEDVLSGMLTAVQDFVRDSFRYGEHRELHHMDFGDYRILIEQGRLVYLAVVYRGDSATIRKKVRSVIDQVETTYGKALENWSGDTDEIIGVRDMMRDHLLGTNGHNARARARAE